MGVEEKGGAAIGIFDAFVRMVQGWSAAEVQSAIGMIGLLGLAYFVVHRMTNEKVLGQVLEFFQWLALYWKGRAEEAMAKAGKESAEKTAAEARAQAILKRQHLQAVPRMEDKDAGA